MTDLTAGRNGRLVLVRHGKSDWSGDHPDHDRPLAPRGRRQAAEAGRWLAAHGPPLEVAIVSPAARAAQTWELVAAELADPPTARVAEAAYTFDGHDLLTLVAGLGNAVLVGHNPALEELVELLTGKVGRMPTSCVAVIEGESLVAHGRPPT